MPSGQLFTKKCQGKGRTFNPKGLVGSRAKKPDNQFIERNKKTRPQPLKRMELLLALPEERTRNNNACLEAAGGVLNVAGRAAHYLGLGRGPKSRSRKDDDSAPPHRRTEKEQRWSAMILPSPVRKKERHSKEMDERP